MRKHFRNGGIYVELSTLSQLHESEPLEITRNFHDQVTYQIFKI